MNANRVPFKLMKATIAALQTASLMVVATLNIDTLPLEHKLVVAKVMALRDETSKRLKAKPPRHKMLALCGGWYRLAEQVQPLIPDTQADVKQSFTSVMDEMKWLADLMQSEVKS